MQVQKQHQAQAVAELRAGGFAMQDENYRDFHAKLIPNVDKETIIGVRVPRMRAYAKALWKQAPETARAFLEALPHGYYEENCLHGLLIGVLSETADEALRLIDRFLPYIDNWATCDITACGMKTLGRAPAAALPRIYEWLASRRTYTVRFGVVALLAHYLDEKFDTHHLDRLTSLPGGEYYVDMAVAWAFSVALVKHFEQTLPYFTQRRLDRRVHNKALQKGRESLRIDDARKTILQRLKY